MVLSLLGPNLEELLISNYGKFNISTVLIADQLVGIHLNDIILVLKFYNFQLSSIEYIHSRNIIHRDLKPANLLIGLGPKNRHVYIVDFGLAKQFRDSETNIHIPYCNNLPLIGTARYASVNVHMGIEHSRRDDIESLAYILIYFMLGHLPWQGIPGAKHQVDVGKKKVAITPEVLCQGLPIEFKLFLQYARSLKFSDRHDYQYIRDLFSNLCQQHANDDLEFSTLGTSLGRSHVSTHPPTISGSDATKA